MNYQGRLKEYDRKVKYYHHVFESIKMQEMENQFLPEEAFRRDPNDIDPDHMTYE